MTFSHARIASLFTAMLPAIASPLASAQARLERDGVVLYWGLVPAAVVSGKHALEEMHGVVPRDGGQNQHLVVALFKADGQRIGDAVVQARLHEVGIVDAAPKYLTPMTIDGQASYGQLFSTAKGGPRQFRILVKLPGRSGAIEFTLSAWSPQRETR